MSKDDGGQSRREVIWAYDTFGHVPAGKYLRELFDKYVILTSERFDSK